MSEPHHLTSPQELAILCVDDEQVILKSLTDQLKTHFGRAYLYETALNGEEALEVLDDLVEEGVKTLLVISDWLMPGMKGDELIIEVHKRFPRTAKVILTGQAEELALERARPSAARSHQAPPENKAPSHNDNAGAQTSPC